MGGRDALETFVPGDHDLLVKIVKETQRRGSAGTKGPWKTFLATLPRGDPSKPVQNDPARRDWQTLAAFCATLTADEDVDLVRRMQKWGAWLREEERLERDDPFPDSPEQGLVARTRAHPTYKQGYDLPAYQEGWALSRRGAVSDAPSRTRLLSVDCEMCKAEGNGKELVRLSVVDQSLEVLLSEFVKPSAKVLDYRTEITGASAKLLDKVTYSHADAQETVLKLLSEPGTILVGHGLQHDLRALKIDHRRVIDTSLIFSYQGLPTAIPALGDLCRAVLEVGFREGGPEQAHDSIEDAKIPMRLVLHEMRNGPTPSLAVPDAKVDKSELSKLFLHKIPKGTPREDLARAFAPDLGAHVQMATWGASGMGTTFALFKNPEVANAAFKALVGKEHKDALGRAQKSVTVLPPADSSEGQKVTFTVRKMGCHNGAAFGVKKKGASAVEGSMDGVTKLEKSGKKKEKVKKGAEKGASEGVKKDKVEGTKNGKEVKGKASGDGNGAEERQANGNGAGQKGALTERVKKDEEGGGESAKKATKQGKSSAERRRAKRALERGEGAVGAGDRGKSEGQETQKRTGADKKKRERSEKDEGKGKGSERGKERKRRRESDKAGGDASKEKSTRERGLASEKKRRVSKEERVSEEGGERHKRRSLDGLLEAGEKRKRGDGELRGAKRARKSEPSATQQTLKEIQRLLASVGKSGGDQPNGKTSSKKSREGKERRESGEHRSKSNLKRREEEKSGARHSGEKRKSPHKEGRNKESERNKGSERKKDSGRKRDRAEKGAGSEKKLKRELAKKDDQLATLTKLVLEMAKGKKLT